MVQGDQPNALRVYSRAQPDFCDRGPSIAYRREVAPALIRGCWRFSLRTSKLFAVALLVLLALSPARSETPEQWIELGARIHGAFGAFIPVGIRIGLDAKERLKADARGLSVTYYNGEKPPCPCVADGVMIATQASGVDLTFASQLPRPREANVKSKTPLDTYIS
jgi:hypothetical protein